MFVYAIHNSATDKLYIGQHAGTDLQAYLAYNIRHAMNKSGNKTYLYRAIRKYGPAVFTIKPLVQPADKQQMDALEIFFIRTLETQNPDIGYNITAGGGGRLGVRRPHTEAEKIAIGDFQRGRTKSPEHRQKIGDAQRGRKFTDEHIKNLKAGQTGKPKRRSPEHCAKIAENKRLWWARKKEMEAANGPTPGNGESRPRFESTGL